MCSHLPNSASTPRKSPRSRSVSAATGASFLGRRLPQPPTLCRVSWVCGFE